MNLQRFMSALILGAVLSAPGQAADRELPASLEPLLTPQLLLGGLVGDQDVSLLFAHLRAAIQASAEGRDPPPMPEALSQRIEAAGGELRVRGTLIGLALSHVMERAVREALLDYAGTPPALPTEQGLQ